VLNCTFFTEICPKGDDPLTPFTDYRAIIITVTQSYARPSSGAYTFTFFDQAIALPISVPTVSECQDIFEALPNVQKVKCGVASNGRYGGYTVLLHFLEWPTRPQENNLMSHEGNPPYSAFGCDTYGIVTKGTVSCTIEDTLSYLVPGMST
jgi:hypothetical protein